MIDLPSVTLLGIDCIHPLKTLKAMVHSMRHVRFAEAVLVSDANDSLLRDACRNCGIRLIHHVTGDRADYEYSMLEHSHEYAKTAFILFQEWDAAVVNPRAWTNEFLHFCYIGAPWVIGSQEEQWWKGPTRRPDPSKAAPVATLHNNVGNGGFCLKSRAFCEAVSKLVDRSNPHQLCSDAWMGRTLRPDLEFQGFRYAPTMLAAQFSCEDMFYSGQFGLHGQNTIKMNNLDWSFDWL